MPSLVGSPYSLLTIQNCLNHCYVYRATSIWTLDMYPYSSARYGTCMDDWTHRPIYMIIASTMGCIGVQVAVNRTAKQININSKNCKNIERNLLFHDGWHCW